MKSKLAILSVAALVLTGCGGTSDNSSTDSAPSTSTSTTAQSPAVTLTPDPGATSPPATTAPPPTPTPELLTPPGTRRPTPPQSPEPSKPLPTAADGTNYKACADARCEVAVRTGTRLPVKKSALGFTNTLVVSRVSEGSVDYGAKGGCCSISTKAQKAGGTYRMNNLKVLTVAVAGKTAILRLSPA